MAEKMSGNRDNKNEKENDNSEENEVKEILEKVGWFALKTAVISGAVIGGIAVAVPLMGFTAAGVAAGSAAAAFQSTFLGGTIAAGSVFATLQSVGAAGLAISTKVGVVAGSALAVTGSELLSKFKKSKKGTKQNDETAMKKMK